MSLFGRASVRPAPPLQTSSFSESQMNRTNTTPKRVRKHDHFVRARSSSSLCSKSSLRDISLPLSNLPLKTSKTQSFEKRDESCLFGSRSKTTSSSSILGKRLPPRHEDSITPENNKVFRSSEGVVRSSKNSDQVASLKRANPIFEKDEEENVSSHLDRNFVTHYDICSSQMMSRVEEEEGSQPLFWSDEMIFTETERGSDHSSLDQVGERRANKQEIFRQVSFEDKEETDEVGGLLHSTSSSFWVLERANPIHCDVDENEEFDKSENFHYFEPDMDIEDMHIEGDVLELHASERMSDVIPFSLTSVGQ